MAKHISPELDCPIPDLAPFRPEDPTDRWFADRFSASSLDIGCARGDGPFPVLAPCGECSPCREWFEKPPPPR